MDVTGALLDRVIEDRADQPDDRSAVFATGGLEARGIDLAGLDLVQDPVDRQFVAVVQVDRIGDLALGGDREFQSVAALELGVSWSIVTTLFGLAQAIRSVRRVSSTLTGNTAWRRAKSRGTSRTAAGLGTSRVRSMW